MATASFRFTVDTKQEDRIVRALRGAHDDARARPGCVECRVERDAAAPGGLRFHSRWEGESDLRAFLASDVMTRLLQLLELSVEEPEVLVCWGDLGSGLRSIEEIRSSFTSGAGVHLRTFKTPESDSGREGDEMKQSWRKTTGVLLLAGAMAMAGMPTSASAQETSPELEGSFEIEAREDLAPAPDGRVVRFVELTKMPLADAGVVPQREAAYRDELRQQRDDFRVEAAARGIELFERRDFEVLFNGLSVEVAIDDLAALESLGTVAATHPVYRVFAEGTAYPAAAPQGTTRENVTVTDLTGVPQAHAAGFTGEGVVACVIDGGIDYNHPALGGGGFPNAKVIGGYDFADDDHDPFDDRLGSVYNHGTHVSGIMAGNDDKMVGVAPDAKIRFYRVFGTKNHGGTEDVLLAAMERAADDGCDVVNMSWGSNRIGVIKNGVMARAADNLVKRDVVAVAAIGNNASGPFLPGSPAIAKSVIAVAAAYNSELDELAVELNDGSTIPYRIMFVGPSTPGSGTFPVVNHGVADCAALPEGTSYEGQVVLVQRGSFRCRPYTQVNLLAEAGAEAVLWWQYSSYPPNQTRFPSQFSSSTIALEAPTAVIRQVDAENIVAQGGAAEVTWGHYYNNATYVPGLPAFFSAWGPTHELDMKPDVMAPGGYMFSSIPGHYGYYGLMDGTSMASPHVAGIAALMRSANPKLKAHEVREILLATSDPAPYLQDPSLGLHPVPQQGAGMVNAMAAIAGVAKAAPAKLALGDLNGMPRTEAITIENKTGLDVIYNVSHVSALTVAPPMTAFWNLATDAAAVSIEPTMLVVPAHGEAQVTVTFDEPAGVPGGSILSGWLDLAPVGGGDSLHVPYVALKGDYHELPAINPSFTDINQSLDNPSLRPESQPFCSGPPPTQAPCCRQPWPGSCGWSVGPSTMLTLDYTNGDKFDDVAFVMISQGFPMLRKYRARVIDESGQTVAWARDRYTGYRSLELFEHWVRNSGTGTGIDFAEWNGLLEDGSPAPAGNYYIRLEFDKLMGDGMSYPDFESWTSPAITIVR